MLFLGRLRLRNSKPDLKAANIGIGSDVGDIRLPFFDAPTSIALQIELQLI
jgi:hypothetical protein